MPWGTPKDGFPALSLRQPWAWLVTSGGKDIENRRWAANYRGGFFVHAAKGMTKKEYVETRAFAADRGVTIPHVGALMLELGGIVGFAEIVGCSWNRTVAIAADVAKDFASHHRRASPSVWRIEGQYGIELAKARPLPFIPCVGALSFFTLPDDVYARAIVSMQEWRGPVEAQLPMFGVR